ncbi:MAG: YjiH family protein [Bacillaceae bacterium]
MKQIVTTIRNHSIIDILKFTILSGLGIFLFMTPIRYNGEITIPIALLSNSLVNAIEPQLPYLVFGLIMITLAGTILIKTVKPAFLTENNFLNNLFNVTPFWFGTRILAAIFITCTIFEIGPDFIYNENTGGLILYSLLPILFSVFFFAGIFLPLLLNFGLLEFIGSLLTKVMRPIFNLPGRSSIDCIASWLGDGTIGVLLTSKQYEEGHYTRREAAVIGTTFSLVSITFSFVVIETVGLSNMFLPFYGTVLLAGLAAAIILPKLPPLSRIPDTYVDGSTRTQDEQIPKGHNSFSIGIKKALGKASKENVVNTVIVNGSKNILDMWLAVIPIVMAVGTVALIIAEFTPIFKIIGLPFYPILELLQIPEALAASQTLVAGFADMLLPSVLASGIESEMTRFIVACVSVTQLIYLSEVGALLLGSKIPLKLKDLFIIFLLRTLVTLPIIALVAHLIY